MFNPLNYQTLQVNETRQGRCPQCGKGKFYVTRKSDGFAFICFRASCDYKGHESALFAATETDRLPKKMPKVFTGGLSLPNRDDIDYFEERFGLDVPDPYPEYWIKVTDDDRYAFPIWGPADEYRGVVIRRASWGGEPQAPRWDGFPPEMPKALTYLETPETTKAAWYHSMREDVVVVVEDQVSAMRIASEGFTGMAILGTNFNGEHARDIIRFKNCHRVIFAYDADATQKALAACRKWGPALRNASVAILDSDIKDISDSTELLRRLNIGKGIE